MLKIFQKLILFVLLYCGAVPAVWSNDLTVSNVALGAREPVSKTLVIKFDVSWENSWRNKINHDAVWLTFRLNSSHATPSYKKICQITSSGQTPSGTSVGSNSDLEIVVPADKNGLFLRRASNSSLGNVLTTNAYVTINYDSCGFSDADEVSASIMGFEMVYIPQGEFFAGDYATSTASLVKGSADNNPWQITSENQISVSNATNNGYRYVSNNNPLEYSTGSGFTLPASYPKGYKSFYAMKYEINEGQWVEFINSLPSDLMRTAHDITDNLHKNTDGVLYRNTVACSSSPLVCSTTRPQRAVTFLSWQDFSAFLDWAALRPMTELEFEKMARGPILPISGEFAWGTTDITTASVINGNEDGTENSDNGNANCNLTHFTGGDSVNSVDNEQGALRNGIFATGTSTRVSSGASYYGVMELSGNVKEYVVSLGNQSGILFTGLNGNGILTSVSGFEGNADVSNWPGSDVIINRGVTGVDGSGLRGGSWLNRSDSLRISDRSVAALMLTTASNDSGGRGVRTYDGN